ncbi:MAG: Molybdopterin guanine dinucleotide synthesis protein B [Methanoregulaceae archaeon PtaB.Bin056]|jgi:molybdopterin-guanine dinucleotide biosynthesis protein MobB|nr:MAG: Molybdopterin guanine dinucleotide synthesis protein B [Methanoregulaceae archaeon PtaB.Bin056]
MRVIHIAGVSGSGKTTFIRSLIPLLRQMGPTAVAKHLGHHPFSLESGKDTTLFLGEGASASAGVDNEKAVVVIRGHTLGDILPLMSSIGTEYLLVEGWKTQPLPKVRIGDLPGATEVVLSNPTAAQVVASIELFPRYYSFEGLTRKVREEFPGGVVLTGRYPAPAGRSTTDSRREFYHRFSPILKEIARVAASRPGEAHAMVHLHRGLLFGGEDEILLAVGARTPAAALEAFSSCQSDLLSALGTGGPHKR